MTDNLRKERDRGNKAKLIIENPLWDECFSKYREALIAHIENPSTDREAAEEARRGLIVLHRVRKHMETIFNTGEMANLELEKPNG